MLSPRFIPESVFYTQSVVRSPCFILTGLKVWFRAFQYPLNYHPFLCRLARMKVAQKLHPRNSKRRFPIAWDVVPKRFVGQR